MVESGNNNNNNNYNNVTLLEGLLYCMKVYDSLSVRSSCYSMLRLARLSLKYKDNLRTAASKCYVIIYNGLDETPCRHSHAGIWTLVIGRVNWPRYCFWQRQSESVLQI